MSTEMVDMKCNETGDASANKTKFVCKRIEEKKLIMLNPMANEWNPGQNGSPVEEKSLYLTFSNRYPLEEHQIFNFFTGLYGACVERVYVHQPTGKGKNGRLPSPRFGKVVFTTSAVPTAVLDGATEKMFVVCGRQMRCKKFNGGF